MLIPRETRTVRTTSLRYNRDMETSPGRELALKRRTDHPHVCPHCTTAFIGRVEQIFCCRQCRRSVEYQRVKARKLAAALGVEPRELMGNAE